MGRVHRRDNHTRVGHLGGITAIPSDNPQDARASLAGDHLRALAASDVRRDDIAAHLAAGGITRASVDPTEPEMEDVFMALLEES